MFYFLLIIFIDIIASVTQFACDVMRAQCVTQLFLYSLQQKNYFFLQSVFSVRPYLIRKNKSGASH